MLWCRTLDEKSTVTACFCSVCETLKYVISKNHKSYYTDTRKYMHLTLQNNNNIFSREKLSVPDFCSLIAERPICAESSVDFVDFESN